MMSSFTSGLMSNPMVEAFLFALVAPVVLRVIGVALSRAISTALILIVLYIGVSTYQSNPNMSLTELPGQSIAFIQGYTQSAIDYVKQAMHNAGQP